jgi:FkbM family methyltransferase
MSIRNRLRQSASHWLARLLQALQTEQADPADVAFAYRLLLGRRPDAQGHSEWLRSLREGFSAGELADRFLSTTEFRDRHIDRRSTRVEAGGFAIHVDADDPYIGRQIAQQAVYEPHVTAVLKRELKPDSVFLDVGANMGWFTLLAASLLREGRVIAVEPNPGNLQLLCQGILANGFHNVAVYPYAASDAASILQLNFHRSNGNVAPATTVKDSLTYVPAARLDDLLRDEPRIDVVKIDIEGHEPIALRGMAELISRHRPIILTEFHPRLIRDLSGLDPADYLRAFQDPRYWLSIVEENGTEVGCQSHEQVMAYWSDLNRRSGGGDMDHLDLVARPL